MKRVIAFILSILTLSTCSAFAFTDVAEDTWYSTAVSELESLGYVAGDLEGNFNPNSNITRKEFTTIILRHQANEEDKEYVYESSLMLSEANNLVDAARYSLSSWNEPITRYETADILARYVATFNINIPEINNIEGIRSHLNDYENVPSNVKESVDFCLKTSLMLGNTEGQFNGDSTLTRAEAAVVIYRLIKPETLTEVKYEEFTQLLSEYTTYTTRDKNRNFNINRAAESLNGIVINPGEVFSYYKAIGNPGKAEGYKESTVISGGKYVRGYGGGVCQNATTLFNAALLANLDIVERRAHGLKATYVDPGYDATFASGSIDFKFRNPYNTPLKIESYFDSSTLAFTVKIYGGETIKIPEVKLYTKGKGLSWELFREADGVVNYNTKSTYRG